jgi:3-hydroxybenzoate/4-hydroxybenzoate---CoA ligase
MNAADAVLGPALQAGMRDSLALIHGKRSLSYGDVVTYVNRAGRGLRALGIGREQRVMLMLKDSPEFVAVYLGAIKIGAVSVPINLRSSPEDLLFYLRDSRARVLAIDVEFLPQYRQIAEQLAEQPIVLVNTQTPAAGIGSFQASMQSLDGLFHGQSAELDYVPMSPDDMAFWIYTSGTTGSAKAAVHLHHDVLLSDAYLRETLGVQAGTRVFATSKLFFAYALGICLFGAFRLGATTILHSEWPTPEAVLEVLKAHQPDVVFSVPTLYRNMLRAGIANQEPFRRVRAYVSAGEKLSESLYSRWKSTTGVEVVEGIGTSETIYMFLTNRPGDSKPGSAGYPAPGAEVRILDDSGHVVMDPGVQGILQVRMASTCDRYWNQQERTQAAFLGEWFTTGDLFTLDARGRWAHQGRRDDMLKISGQWVSPSEIEECVLALPAVADAVVIGINDKDGLMRLVLYAVPADAGGGTQETEDAIRLAITEHLSVYKCPRNICFVPELPRTASGKVQRFRLRQEMAFALTIQR